MHFEIVFISSMFVILPFISEVESLSCRPCKDVKCLPVGNCKAGKVMNACDCCEICAKDLNEKCGGSFDMHGKCGNGLECWKPTAAPKTTVIYGITVEIFTEEKSNATGVCIKI